ncbi:MAG: hypothetical protein ACJ0J7_05795 [Tepidiformaceae bacterium]
MVTESGRTRTPMEKAPEPVLGTELIPKERYISEEYRQLEWDRMWDKGLELGWPSAGYPKPW